MKTHSVKKKQPCDICGDVGFASSLSTCCICHISHEHIYCMKNNLFEVPKEWICEACLSRNMKDDRGEAHLCKKGKILCTESDSPKIIDSTNTRNVSKFSRAPHNSAFSPPKKNYIKVVETGKVKFLPAEDVVALTPGTNNVKASALRGRLSSQVGFYPISRTPISVAEASKRSLQKESTCGSSGPPTPLMVGSMKKNTTLQQEVFIKNLQDKPVKEKSNEPKFLDDSAVFGRPNEEYISEKEPLHATPPKKPRTSLTKTKAVYIAQNTSSPFLEANPNVLPKAEELPNHYAINPTWKGTFEICDRFPLGRYYEYEGLRAHPPHQVSRKAYEFSKQMPITLQFKVHPRCDVWPEIFHIDCPTVDDIALYFLPEDFSSSKMKYHFLLEFMEMEDLAMSTCLNDVELIIFTSRQLSMDSQRLNMKFFLWGVFRSSKRQLLSQSVTKETDKVVDMEIDMVEGKDLGRVAYLVKRPVLERNKVQFTLHNQKVEYPISSALCFKKLDSSKSGDGVAGSGNDEAGPSPDVVSNIPSDQPMKGNISPTSKIKREMSSDLRASPGFCRTVTSDVAHKGVMETPLGRVSIVGRNLERPPGFSKFLKPKETSDPSEAGDIKEKIVISQSSSKNENTSHSYHAKRVFKEPRLLSPKFSGDGVAGSGNDEAGPSPNVVSNIPSDQPMKGNISPTSKIKREMSSDLRASPGFCRTVTSDVAHKGVMEKPLGRVSIVGRNLERPPGFSKFLKPKETSDPSEAGVIKKKVVISQSSSKNENTSHSYHAKRVFKEPHLLSPKFIQDWESPELPFISQQSEHKQLKPILRKCQLEQCVKKEDMEETDSSRMVSLSSVYMKDEHHWKSKESLKKEGFGSDCDQPKRR